MAEEGQHNHGKGNYIGPLPYRRGTSVVLPGNAGPQVMVIADVRAVEGSYVYTVSWCDSDGSRRRAVFTHSEIRPWSA
jgi:hypothetical protein